MSETAAPFAPDPALNALLQAMAGRLAAVDLLTEQAFLQVGRQVEEGRRRALGLANLAEQALPLDAGETNEQTIALLRQQAGLNATWLSMHLQQHSAKLAGSFGELVAALQFQDITRQRLQHIRQALGGLESAIADGTADDAAIAKICQLQHDQLQLAIHEFCGALGRLDDNLLGMAGNVQALAEATCTALLAGSNQERALNAAISEQAAEIGHGLRTARAGIDIRGQFLAQVEPVLTEFLTLTREHGGAERMTGDGQALDGLQKRYTMMSERVVHLRFMQEHALPSNDGAQSEPAAAASQLDDNIELF
jgi:hypothetical protein